MRMSLCAALLVGVGTGCPKENVKRTQGPPDPDTNSGPDAKQNGAKPITPKRDSYNPNKLVFTETDSVSWPRLMRTKWKRIDLQNQGTDNQLYCELRIDNQGADLNLDIFNGLGTQIGFSPGPAPNHLKTLKVTVEDLGSYFVRVRAAQPKDESDFSVFCSWEEKPPEPGKPPPTPTPVKPGVKPPKPTPVEPANDIEMMIENGTEGRIIQAYRESGKGGKMILQLDKGSVAGVRVGTEGTILVGPSGRARLEGGAFRVVKVLDDNRSTAEADIRSVGRNNRVVFFIK